MRTRGAAWRAIVSATALLLGGPGGARAAVEACPPPFEPMPGARPPEPPLRDPAAGAPLRLAWEVRPPPGSTLSYDGLLDGAGRAYWRETVTATGATRLASADPDGALRFRVEGPARPVALALAGPVLVVASLEAASCPPPGGATPVVEGYSTADGRRLWRTALQPIIEGWLRGPPAPSTCRYGGLAGLAVGARLLLAVSVLDRAALAHESGYVALDPATGAVAWAARTSAPGNTQRSGPPALAEDGAGYGAATLDYRRDALLRLPAAGPPAALWTPPAPWHGFPLAAAGPLLLTEATGGAAWEPPPRGLEVRCRATGAALSPAGALRGLPLVAAGALWLFGDELARYDLASGRLSWRVRLGEPGPAAGRPRAALLRSWPVVTAGGGVLFVEQPVTQGPAPADLRLGQATLRLVDAGGAEALRRPLPPAAGPYGPAVALERGRALVAEQSAGSGSGALRAFALPGQAPARHGWITVGGSQARDGRAR